MKSLSNTLLFTLILCAAFPAFAQDCAVDDPELKGTYTGGCKKGKANGEGTAVGVNTYEGQFKSGLPHGRGTYTWENGDVYTGSFEKGLKHGAGRIVYKSSDGIDDVLEGFWKENEYVGKYAYPYKVISRSKKVTQATITPSNVGAKNQIDIAVSSTTANAASLSGSIAKAQVSNLLIQQGGYERTYPNNTYPRKSVLSLFNVWFPFVVRIDVGTEYVEVEINEEGSYVIQININQ